MTAGRGIVHSERSPQSERDAGPRLYGMQTWLALPDGKEEIAPAFEAVKDLPLIEDQCVTARVIMANCGASRRHHHLCRDDLCRDPARPFGRDPDRGRCRRARGDAGGGEASLDGRPLDLYVLTVLRPGAEMVLTSERGGRVMLLGGEAFATSGTPGGTSSAPAASGSSRPRPTGAKALSQGGGG